jgi:hypothetical protein
MGRYYKFECTLCGFHFTLQEGGDGWVDDHGRFGFAFHPQWEPIGQPQDNIHPICFDNYLCLDCSQVFIFISSNLPIPIQPEHQIVDNRDLWFIQGASVDESHDPETNLPLYKTTTPCIRCGGRIVGSLELLLHVLNRHKIDRYGITPLNSESDAYTCPKCKAIKLSYAGFMQS